MPPLLEIPAPVTDLTAEQIGARVLLRFTSPRMTTEGTLVRYLGRIEVHGAFLPENASLEVFPEREQSLRTLSAQQIPEGVAQVLYEFPLEASHRGAKAVFALKAVNHRGMDGGFSNVAWLELADLPGPPTGLEATLTEQSIQLRWTPSGMSAFDGSAIAPDEYEVYRSEAGSDGPTQRLANTGDPFYEDRAFAFGTRYIYAVRAIAVRGDSTARTPESNRVEVAAVDVFPPAAPQNLRAIAVAGAIDLAWSPNTESDLAGYNIYRGIAGGEFARLNREPVDLPLYRDASVRSGGESHYRVQAVDHRGNEGPPSDEAIATAE